MWPAGTNIRQHQAAERHCTVHSSSESQIVVLFYGYLQQLEITRQRVLQFDQFLNQIQVV